MSTFLDDIYKAIGANDANQDVKDWLGSGFLPLNKALSGRFNGGFPVGRITEIFGAESCGKTMLATMAMAETQRKGGLAVFLDYEHAFSVTRAKTLGLVDAPEQWIYKQPETAEDGFKIIELVSEKVRKANSNMYVTVVIDSVASMITKEEMDTDFGEGNMRTRNSLPLVMAESLKKVAKQISKHNVTLLFLNQVRDNPGVMFGDKEKTPGGRALKFFASTRLKLVKTGKLKEGTDVIGENVLAQVVKNKVYEPFKTARYISHFTEGINLHLSHIEVLNEMGKLGSKAGWVEFEGKSMRVGQLEKLTKDDPAAYERLLMLFDEVAS